MGAANAARELQDSLARAVSSCVITCGFAGGLNPALRVGELVFQADDSFSAKTSLARPGTFHCAPRVAVMPAEKLTLWQETGADAVEMESGVIRSICRERGIPSATLRVISDAAGDSLPLDFNALMTSEFQMNWGKFAGQLLRRPSKIPELMAFQRQIGACAVRLASALEDILAPP